MPFPETRAAMIEAGYSYITMKTCPCGEVFELWKTPNKAMMPMNRMWDENSKAVSHWATCVKAIQFRRRKP